jgi:bacterial leucyl aminopeptidase
MMLRRTKADYYIGSRIDISPEFSFTHLLEFAKLATAFAIELGGWEKA